MHRCFFLISYYWSGSTSLTHHQHRYLHSSAQSPIFRSLPLALLQNRTKRSSGHETHDGCSLPLIWRPHQVSSTGSPSVNNYPSRPLMRTISVSRRRKAVPPSLHWSRRWISSIQFTETLCGEEIFLFQSLRWPCQVPRRRRASSP